MSRTDPRTRRGLPLCLLAIAGLALSACAPVQPWKRGDLAMPEMAFEADPVLAGYRDRLGYSKEAASGGKPLGGGCGCN